MEMVRKTLPPLPLHLQRRLGPPHQRHASKTDHPQSPTSALLHQSSVPCSKILRRTEGYYRSLPPKQAHPLPHVSHAGRNKTLKLHPSSLLFHLNRPVRSIPSHSDPPQVSKVAFLFPRQQSLFLSSNAFRNKPRTVGLRIFTKVITKVLKLLHLQNIHVSVYIDDFLLWNTSASTLARQTKTATTLLTNLGLSVNWEKSSLTPLQQITYLGVRWCGESHSLLPSRPNIDKSQSLICQSSIISKKLHQCLLVLGTLNILAPYLAQGKLRLRLIILHAPSFKKKLRVPIPPHWRNLLLWWQDEKNLSQPAPISLPPPTVTFWTDASRSGWGGVSSLGLSASGCWTPEEKLLHINILECLAVLRSLLALPPPNQSSILIRSDSTVIVSLINKQGSNKSKSLTKALHSLLLCESYHWHLTGRHIPGHLNSWADSLSRDHPIRAEWELNSQSFRQLPNHDLLQIDLLAHPGNAKLPVFGCLFNHPAATVIDSLSSNWKSWEAIYLFPPLSLLPACLRKLETYSGVSILIAPLLPAARWWPALRERFESLDLNLDVFQTIQGRTLWAHEVTSLRFRAFNFLPKSTPPPSLQMSPLPLRRPITLPLPRSTSDLGKISNSGFRNTLTLPSPRNSPSSTSTT